jgi:hypothetical protein
LKTLGAAAVAGELKLFAEAVVLGLDAEGFAVGLATGATLASGLCDILANASGEMATISTPSGVSRVDNTKASPPTCSRTSLSASVVVAAMILWGAI